MHAWQNIRPFWSITCWVVVIILGHANTNMTCLNMLAYKMINFCYMTQASIHYVHDYNFDTHWL